MSAACNSCGGRCCREVYVTVTVFDAWRIAKRLNVPWTTFVDPMNPGPRGPMGLFLLRNADDTACRELGPDGRCTIYEFRPLMCRVYPFTTVRGVTGVRNNVRCKPDDWDISLIDFPAIRLEIARYRAEEEAQNLVIDVWDASPHQDRSFERFCDYAASALDHFFAHRNEEADRVVIDSWNEAGAPREYSAAQAAWLSDLATSCRQAYGLDGVD